MEQLPADSAHVTREPKTRSSVISRAQRGAPPEPSGSSNLSTINTPSWQEWQQAVVSQIRRDFRQVLTEDVGAEDFDWDAWRPLYEQGLSPAQAVADALLLPA
jgi:hypothetical protein